MPETDKWPIGFEAAAAMLLRSVEYATALQRPWWDFAIEIEDLQRSGLSRSDLRWLVCGGLLEHATECSSDLGDKRTFKPMGMLTFASQTCFILTSLGQKAACKLERQSDADSQREGHGRDKHHFDVLDSKAPNATLSPFTLPPSVPRPSTEHSRFIYGHGDSLGRRPRWDRDLSQLLLGDLIVKEYKTPAPNQQLILCVFEEEEWPTRIDDPLPPASEIDPKRRLNETISALNRNQKNRVLRFSGDGSGRGVRWSSSGAVSVVA